MKTLTVELALLASTFVCGALTTFIPAPLRGPLNTLLAIAAFVSTGQSVRVPSMQSIVLVSLHHM